MQACASLGEHDTSQKLFVQCRWIPCFWEQLCRIVLDTVQEWIPYHSSFGPRRRLSSLLPYCTVLGVGDTWRDENDQYMGFKHEKHEKHRQGWAPPTGHDIMNSLFIVSTNFSTSYCVRASENDEETFVVDEETFVVLFCKLWQYRSVHSLHISLYNFGLSRTVLHRLCQAGKQLIWYLFLHIVQVYTNFRSLPCVNRSLQWSYSTPRSNCDSRSTWSVSRAASTINARGVDIRCASWGMTSCCPTSRLYSAKLTVVLCYICDTTNAFWSAVSRAKVKWLMGTRFSHLIVW